MFAVSCCSIEKTFRGAPRKALSDVSFHIQPGETFGILGANGSGKSTLIRIISTLLMPDGGRVEVFGHDVCRRPDEVRRLIHRVSVEAAFIKKMSAWENLLFSARLYGLGATEARRRAEEILTRLGFPLGKLDEILENQSRGLQQKVAIARAMLVKPALLLLDEPTTGLDPLSRRQVQAYLEECRAQDGVSILLTTHDMTEAERLCQRLAIMKAGRIVAMGSPAELRQASSATLEELFIQLAEEMESHAHVSE